MITARQELCSVSVMHMRIVSLQCRLPSRGVPVITVCTSRRNLNSIFA